MKYAVLIGDGMADYPIPELGGKTPLESAPTPHMDRCAAGGVSGMVRNVPAGMHPGSDTANLSIFGYDPVVSYTGRAPLEALNMGIVMEGRDAAFRCNMVDIRDGIMHDFSASHIESAFSGIIMRELADGVPLRNIEYHSGVSYRNLVIWRDFPHDAVPDATPPHDIQGRPVKDHLPRGEGSEVLLDIMKRSETVIANSKAVREAAAAMKGSPTGVWIWGGGRKPAMEPLPSRYGLRGHTISAVDLIHGIGRAAGLEPIHVGGATGYLDTNYEGKAAALLDGLSRGADIVFLHVESPDESGHEGSLEHKLRAIADFDSRIVGPVLEGMGRFPEWAVLVLPDHPTPLSLRTHTGEPVPFAMLRSGGPWETPAGRGARGYSERDAAGTGLSLETGYRLLELLIHNRP